MKAIGKNEVLNLLLTEYSIDLPNNLQNRKIYEKIVKKSYFIVY